VHTNNKRPVFLHLLKIRLPIGGIVSILHRVTGVLLVMLVPALVWGLDRAAGSPRGYQQLIDVAHAPAGRLVILLVAGVTVQHLFSGIRHLLLDLDVGIERESAARTAWSTLVLSVLVLAITGAWLW